jgi:hypothetical protein
LSAPGSARVAAAGRTRSPRADDRRGVDEPGGRRAAAARRGPGRSRRSARRAEPLSPLRAPARVSSRSRSRCCASASTTAPSGAAWSTCAPR